MITISIINQKGGVGKTTSAQNIATFWAKNGKKILLIDADPQRDLSKSFGLDYQKPTILELLKLEEIKPFEIEPNLFLISGISDLLDLVGKELKKNTIKTKLKNFKSLFDYCIIDCQPQNISEKTLTINETVLIASDFILIPADASFNSLTGAFEFLEKVSYIRKTSNNKLKLLGIVLTIINQNEKISKEYREFLKQNKELYFRAYIRIDAEVKKATAINKSVFNRTPNSRGARDYKRLAEEIEEKIKNYENE